MIREFVRAMKYLFAGIMVDAFVVSFRIRAGAQITADTMLFTGVCFLVLVLFIAFWQMRNPAP